MKCFLVLSFALVVAGAPPPLPSLLEQATLQQSWLKHRLEVTLPDLIQKHGIDMWLVSSR